jgi:predicted O-methyltransferase YrrM
MDLIQKDINGYLQNVTPPRDEVLAEMEKYAEKNQFPIVGPLVGRLLYMYASLMGAKKVLELGSGYGYSAYWFAKAIGSRGKVICTEGNPANAERAKKYFARGGIGNKVDFRVGDALQIIDGLKGNFDIIFNDVDKYQYPMVFGKALGRLRKGGLLISDNLLWSGKILDKKRDADTNGIIEYTRLIYTSKDLFTIIVPLRDGVSVSLKL